MIGVCILTWQARGPRKHRLSSLLTAQLMVRYGQVHTPTLALWPHMAACGSRALSAENTVIFHLTHTGISINMSGVPAFGSHTLSAEKMMCRRVK